MPLCVTLLRSGCTPFLPFPSLQSSKGQRAIIHHEQRYFKPAFGVASTDVDAHLASLIWRCKQDLKAAVRSKPDDALVRLSHAKVAAIQVRAWCLGRDDTRVPALSRAVSTQAAKYLDVSAFYSAFASLELVVDYMDKGRPQALKLLNCLATITYKLRYLPAFFVFGLRSCGVFTVVPSTFPFPSCCVLISDYFLNEMVLPFYTISKRQTKRLRDAKTEACAEMLDLCEELHISLQSREPASPVPPARLKRIKKWRRSMVRDSVMCCGRHVCQRETVLMSITFTFAVLWTYVLRVICCCLHLCACMCVCAYVCVCVCVCLCLCMCLCSCMCLSASLRLCMCVCACVSVRQ